MEWVSKAEQLHASLTSLTQCKVSDGVYKARHHWTLEFCRVMNHTSLSGSLIGESGFGQTPGEHHLLDCTLSTVKFFGRGMMAVFRGFAGLLISSEGES